MAGFPTPDLLLLQLLQGEPTTGYELTLRIPATTSDVINVEAGSLYPALSQRPSDSPRAA